MGAREDGSLVCRIEGLIHPEHERGERYECREVRSRRWASAARWVTRRCSRPRGTAVA